MFLLHCTYSQSTLSFCASVDQTGYCIFNNNKFFLTADTAGTKIFMELKTANGFVGIPKVTFKIYSIQKGGVEKYECMTDQNVQDTWIFAWTPHMFQTAGKYNVKVFNDKDELMISRTLELFDGK
jgi:hypothetical protein